MIETFCHSRRRLYTRCVSNKDASRLTFFLTSSLLRFLSFWGLRNLEDCAAFIAWGIKPKVGDGCLSVHFQNGLVQLCSHPTSYAVIFCTVPPTFLIISRCSVPKDSNRTNECDEEIALCFLSLLSTDVPSWMSVGLRSIFYVLFHTSLLSYVQNPWTGK